MAQSNAVRKADSDEEADSKLKLKGAFKVTQKKLPEPVDYSLPGKQLKHEPFVPQKVTDIRRAVIQETTDVETKEVIGAEEQDSGVPESAFPITQDKPQL